MAAIASGHITAIYLFDVAEEIDLAQVPRLLAAQPAPARLMPKPATPAYVQYQTPPLVVDGEALQRPEIDGFRARFRVYPYGIISVALARPFSGTWAELVAAGHRLIEGEGLAARAEGACLDIARRLGPVLQQPRASVSLNEDYIVFALTAHDPPLTAETLLEQHGDDIARLLRGERGTLSTQERDEVLRHRISYLADDLAVPSWNAALVCDTEAGAQAAAEIFEFANSQLLEFRYYDALLDAELARIYDDLQRPRPLDAFGRRYIRAANQLHALFVDVSELTDKTENALKIVGDVYAARLYGLVAARLGLEAWKQSVAEKLKTLDDIYRFSVEQTQMSRGHLLELTIIAILVLELVLFFMGIMK
jgi:hypothetical protein